MDNPENQYRRKAGSDSPSVKRGASPRRPQGRRIEQNEIQQDAAKLEKRRLAKKKMVENNAKSVLKIVGIVVAISIVLASISISCINDILAVHVSSKKDEKKSVVITEDMDTNDVIKTLDKAGLITNGIFCKAAAVFFGYTNEGYIAGTYELNKSMGLEKMLNEIKNMNSKTAKTVTLTFPEGYTADQILAQLEKEQVCTRAKMIEYMKTADLSSDYDFLKNLTEVNKRYINLEGFLYPDTYEFYLGETPESVLGKFLTNFKTKWTDDYGKKAKALGYSVDQVVILASIVEKEAGEADMPTVASILFNRIDASMKLECNSTSIYIGNTTGGLTDAEKSAFNSVYDTYTCTALPVGAICNPGDDAISAVLNAPSTGYYYFIHDKDNVFHAAKSLSDQEYNISQYGLAE